MMGKLRRFKYRYENLWFDFDNMEQWNSKEEKLYEIQIIYNKVAFYHELFRRWQHWTTKKYAVGVDALYRQWLIDSEFEKNFLAD